MLNSQRVTSPILEALAERLASSGQFRHQNGRPHVTLAYAQSLDGSIAQRPGRPLSLSCPSSLALTHELRAAHDGILIGIGTAVADNPQLTVRLVPGENPRPVVVDSRLRLPLDSRLLARGRGAEIATTDGADTGAEEALAAVGARVTRLPALANGWVDLRALANHLAEARGTSSLLVEGGSRILTSFINARLADYVVITVSPRYVGGVSALARQDLPDFPRLGEWQSERVGDDLVLAGELRFE